jgi:8-oxo-dGTP diphosphatase
MNTPLRIAEIDWTTWTPKERAVLCFIQQGSRLLLIHKKTGLGAGKINAPGGRIEPGETAAQAAVREVQEEVGVTPHQVHEQGQLFFIFTDGYSLHGTVFFATGHTGTPIETAEAKPFWCEIAEIPYHQMWADDLHWLPLALAGTYFKGHFIFDNDTMLEMKVESGVLFKPLNYRQLF